MKAYFLILCLVYLLLLEQKLGLIYVSDLCFKLETWVGLNWVGLGSLVGTMNHRYCGK